MIAYALVARKGSKESCNCGLRTPQDTDNHIVLVEEMTLALTARATPAKPATSSHKAVKAQSAAQNTLHVRDDSLGNRRVHSSGSVGSPKACGRKAAVANRFRSKTGALGAGDRRLNV